MSQIKVFGNAKQLNAIKPELSDAIHSCVMEALALPVEKRFHRFFPLAPGDFVYPTDRSERYTIIEISMFAGRSVEAKKRLLRLLFERLHQALQLEPHDVEITIIETPRENWGIRGQPGDELSLSYPISV